MIFICFVQRARASGTKTLSEPVVIRRYALIAASLLGITLVRTASARTAAPASDNPAPQRDGGTTWTIQCVDCPKYFNRIGRSLALDAGGWPHIAYGGDHLYYAWYDGTTWHLETVDSALGVGTYASLALDNAHHAHISYYDATNGNGRLKYARWTGSAWDIQIVDRRLDNYGGHTSLALDAAGNPHISYYDYRRNNLKYARWTGGAWDIQIVDSDGGRFTSLALDASGNPRVSYRASDYLKYARWTGSAWDIQIVDSVWWRLNSAGSFEPVISLIPILPNNTNYTSLALDAFGNPHISYDMGGLKYAHWTGSGWDTQFVDGGGSDTSLVLDDVGHPHIGYYNRDLKYAHWTGDAWDIQTVDSDGDMSASLTLDAAGYPHVTYYDGIHDALKYARRTDSGWDIQTVDGDGNVGQYASLALDAAGHPRVGYYDVGDQDLKYARWADSGWEVQTVDSDGYIGKYVSLALDAAGAPHISYRDYLTLKYARWTGAAWDIQIVDSGSVGSYTSLALDASGNPHISYRGHVQYSGLGGDLKYARWMGSNWDIQTVDSDGDVGDYTSLALDAAGCPHIAYYDSTNSCLKYAHWTGSAWDIQIVDSGGAVGISLALDAAGHPHISYHTGMLKYARWTGSAWVRQLVRQYADNYGDVASYTSLALDAFGNPHITYYNNKSLMYVRWTGDVWETQTVDVGLGRAGQYTSLVLDAAGNSHVSYYDYTNKDLKYAVGRISPPPLSLDKQATPSGGLHNHDTLTYTLTLSGSGLSARLRDPLPAGVRYVSGSLTGTVTPLAVYSPTVRAIVWQGTLPTGTAQMVSFQVTANVAGTGASPVPIVNTAWLADADSGATISAIASVDVWPPSFSLRKQAMPSGGLRNDDTLTYTLTLSGPGLSVHLWDPLPPAVRYVSGSLTGTVSPLAVYSPTVRAVAWRGTLPTDTTRVVRFRVTPGITGTGSLSVSPPIVNTAWLTDAESGWSISAIAVVNGWRVYLPLIVRNN